MSGARLGTCARKRVVIFSGGYFFLISFGGQAPHVRCTPMGHARGEQNDVELPPIGVELNPRICGAYLAGVEVAVAQRARVERVAWGKGR